MTTSINTNVSAYFAQNNLRSSSASAQSSIARLSSGNRIIRASDDVAALSIGTVLRTDVSTLKTALSNTSQASSLIQVADGALQRLGEILQRQKALATQGNADTLSDTERGYLDTEFQQLVSEYDRIANKTNFNGITLLNGNLSGAFQAASGASTGTIATSNITITPANSSTITAISVSSLGTNATTGGQNLNALFTADNLATLTVAATPTDQVIGDFSLGRTINTIAPTNVDTAAKLNSVTRFLGGLSGATVAFTGNVADNGTGTISIVSGGRTFTSATADFSGNPASITLTDATVGSLSGATITLDLNTLPGSVTNTATLVAAGAAVQAELRSGTYATTAAAGDFTLTASDANITSASVASLGTDAETGLQEVASFLNGISTATVAVTPSPAIAGDFTETIVAPVRSTANFNVTGLGASVTSLTATSIGTDAGVRLSTFGAAINGGSGATVTIASGPATAPLHGTYSTSFTSGDLSAVSVTNAGTLESNRQTFLRQFTTANLAAATATISDGGTASDSLGTLTVNVGTLSFVSAADAFQTNTNAGAITLTDATTGATISLDFNALGQSIAEAGAAAAAVQAAVRTISVTQAANDTIVPVGGFTVTAGGIAFTNTSTADLSGNPAAITLTDATSGATISLDLAALSVTDLATADAAASTIQTAIRAAANVPAASSVITAIDVTSTGSSPAAFATAFTTANLSAATVSLTGGITGDSSTGTVRITIGGINFDADPNAIDSNNNNGPVAFTSSTGASFTLDLIDMNRADLGTTGIAAIQDSLRAVTIADAGANGRGKIAITAGGQTYESSATANFADGQAAVTFTNTSTNASTLSINFADLGITSDINFNSSAAAIQTAVRTITTTLPTLADSDFTVTPVVSSLSVTGLGTNTAVGGAAVAAFIAGNDSLFAEFTGAVANDGTGVLSLTAGGVTFATAAGTSFTSNPAAVTLTDAVSGATISLDLSNLNLVSNNTAGLLAATSTVQDALRGLDARNVGTDGAGKLAITIGTTVFSSPVSSNFADGQGAVLFTSNSTNAEILSINLADLGIDSDADLTNAAASLQTALRGSTYNNTFLFEATDGKTGAAAFQVGTESNDTISISISDVRTSNVYRNDAGVSTVLNIGNKADAIIASAVLDNAIDQLTSVRAQVGAAQSRFNFAASTLETSVQNLDAARAGFLDADISNESTAFASQQVLIQASISVLAQANQLPQNLLKLIG